MDIAGNISIIKNRIVTAAAKTGRNPNDVKLIAVTKTVTVENMQKAVDAGIKALGENRVQEAIKKQPFIKGDIEWHLIGHLQRNKVRYVVGKFDLIHSLDSLSLAEVINECALKNNVRVDALVQVNISGEKTKYGIKPEETRDFIAALSEFGNLTIKGLMTIAPYTDDPEDVRVYFKKMKALFDSFKEINQPNVNMRYLSMGMTNDFEVAVEEGANMIRIGTGIFGERNY